MPVPKGFEYGKIIGHLINMGYSKEKAKAKTENAMKKFEEKKRQKKSK